MTLISRGLAATALLFLLAACPDRNDDPEAPAAVTTPPISSTARVACGLSDSFIHKTKHDGNRKVLWNADAMVFRSNYAVNTDGAPNSYHPDDPKGENGLAINTICNGANAYTATGEKLNYSKCTRLRRVFERVRQDGWDAHPTRRMEFYGVAPKPGSGKRVPCINDDPAWAGYFVSQTRFAVDPTLGNCKQEKYLNSLTQPFLIVPRKSKFTREGVGQGDLAVSYHVPSGRIVFGMIGDVGPNWGLGEGSVFTNQQLRGVAHLPKTKNETYGYGARDVVTVFLPNENYAGPYTTAGIDAAASAAFDRFGGLERLQACAAELP